MEDPFSILEVIISSASSKCHPEKPAFVDLMREFDILSSNDKYANIGIASAVNKLLVKIARKAKEKDWLDLLKEERVKVGNDRSIDTILTIKKSTLASDKPKYRSYMSIHRAKTAERNSSFSPAHTLKTISRPPLKDLSSKREIASNKLSEDFGKNSYTVRVKKDLKGLRSLDNNFSFHSTFEDEEEPRFASTSKTIQEDWRINLIHLKRLRRLFLQIEKNCQIGREKDRIAVEHSANSILSRCFYSLKVYLSEQQTDKKIMVKGYMFFKLRLLTKAMYSWRSTIEFRKAFKRFVLKRIARQKMKSKFAIFSVIKSNYEVIKSAERSWNKSLNFYKERRQNRFFVAWRDFARTKSLFKTKENYIMSRHYQNVVAGCLQHWMTEYSERISLRHREEFLKERIMIGRKKQAFIQFLACIEEFSYEKSLERRSNFLLGIFGARRFFNKANVLVHINRALKVGNKIADEHYYLTSLQKGFFGLIDERERTYSLCEQADAWRMQKLLIKGLRAIMIYYERRMNKIPLYSSRQVYLGAKYLGLVTDRIQEAKVYNKTLTYMEFAKSIERQSYSVNVRAQKCITSDNSIYEDVEEEREQYSYPHARQPFQEDYEAGHEIEEQDPKSISSTDKMPSLHDDHFMTGRTNNERHMPFLTQRVKPMIYQRSNDILQFAIKENIFNVLKSRIQKRKEFIRKRLIKIARGCFAALRDRYYLIKDELYLQNRAHNFRRKRIHRSIFFAWRSYSKKIKILRHRELEYSLVNRDRMIQNSFYHFWHMFSENRNERINSQISENHYKSSLGWRSLKALADNRAIKEREYNAFQIIKYNHDRQIARRLINEWANLVPVIQDERVHSRIILCFRSKVLLGKAFFGFRKIWEEVKIENNKIYFINNKIELRILKACFGTFNEFRYASQKKKAVYRISDTIYYNNLMIKSMIGLNCYVEYRSDKKKSDAESIKQIQLINRKTYLRHWYLSVFSRAKTRTFCVRMQELTMQIAFRKINSARSKDRSKILYFKERRPVIMLGVFFNTWRSTVKKERMLKQGFEQIRSSKELNSKRRTFMIMFNSFHRNMNNCNHFYKAILSMRNAYLSTCFEAWKKRVERKKIPNNFKENTRRELKHKIFLVLSQNVEKRRHFRKCYSIIATLSESKIKRKYLTIILKEQARLKTLKKSYRNIVLAKKQQFMNYWIDAYNMSKRCHDNPIILEDKNIVVPLLSDKFNEIKMGKKRKLFNSFAQVIFDRREQRIAFQTITSKIEANNSIKLKENFLGVWKVRASERIRYYNGIKNLSVFFMNMKVKNEVDCLKVGLSEIVVESELVKQEAANNSKAKWFRKRALKGKLFRRFKSYYIQAINRKKGFTILRKLCRIIPQKQTFFERTRLVWEREIILFDLIKNYESKIALLNRNDSLLTLKENCLMFRRKELYADKYHSLLLQQQKKIILKSWSLVLVRKKNSQQVGYSLEKSYNVRIASELFQHWKFRVLEDGGSIYNRQLALTNAINKLHILRAIDKLREFKEDSINRKTHICKCISVIEEWISKKLMIETIERLKDNIEYQDQRDYFLERLTTIVNRNLLASGFCEFLDEIKTIKLSEAKCIEFQNQRLTRKLKPAVKKWRLLMKLRSELLPQLILSNQQSLIQANFQILKKKVLEDPDSLYNRSRLLKSNLEKIRKRRTLLTMKTHIKMRKFKNEVKRKKILKLLVLIEHKLDKKVNIAYRRFANEHQFNKGLILLHSVVGNNLKRVGVNSIKEEYTREKRNEEKLKTLDYKRKYRIKRKCLNQIQSLSSKMTQNYRLMKAFRKNNDLFMQPRYLKIWINRTLKDVNSIYNKTRQADLVYSLNMKSKVFTGLAGNLQDLHKERRIVKFEEDRKKRVMSKCLLQLWINFSSKQHKLKYHTLLRCFFAWKEYTSHEKIMRQYLEEEESLMVEDDQRSEAEQKDRFMALLLPGLHPETSESIDENSGIEGYSLRNYEPDFDEESEFEDYKSAF